MLFFKGILVYIADLSTLNKKQFERVISDATTEKYNFLYINNHADPSKKLRKNLDEIINLDEYKI